MTLGQIILAIITASLITVTYLFGPLTNPDKEKTLAAAPQAQAWDFEQYKTQVIDSLSAEDRETYNALKETLTSASADSDKISALKALNSFFESNGNRPLGVTYLFQASEIENSGTGWNATGDETVKAYYTASMPALQKYLIGKAAESYEKAIALEPDSTDIQIKLATAYMEGSERVMEGVQILLGILDKDENNLDANLILGRYGIISGQFDKAIKRLEKVLQNDSVNAEAYFYLAEAYQAMGDKSKALELFEKCKTLVNKTEFSMEIDQYIENLKNS